MNKKLTLSLDETVIVAAKDYAEMHHDSLSNLVEKYFKLLVIRAKIDTDSIKNKDIDSITGIIELPSDFDEKKQYRDYRAGKSQ